MNLYSIPEIAKALANTNFVSDKKQYLLVQLDKSVYPRLLPEMSLLHDEFVEVIRDKNEISLLIAKDTWEKELASFFNPLQSYGPLAIITCDVTTENPTGYLLAYLSILSPNNIDLYVQGAFTTDHICVDYVDLDKTFDLLNQLKGSL